jgi:hypothetical protein
MMKRKAKEQGVSPERLAWLKQIFDNAVREGVNVTGIILPRKTPEGRDTSDGDAGMSAVLQQGNSR